MDRLVGWGGPGRAYAPGYAERVPRRRLVAGGPVRLYALTPQGLAAQLLESTAEPSVTLAVEVWPPRM